MTDSNWLQKGGTLSDKSARDEFGLSQDEIVEAIKAGKLQYRENYMHDNPYFRLIREEVEALVIEKYGENYIKNKKLKNELGKVNKNIKKLKAELVSLEKRRVELMKSLEE